MNRVLTTLLGLALIGLAPVATTGAADAATTTGQVAAAPAATTSTTTATSQRAALDPRKIRVKIKQPNRRTLILRGHVGGKHPTYDEKVVKIQRKTSKHGNWKLYAKARTDKDAVFKHRIGAPRHGRWYFRAMTEKSKHYAKSVSQVYYTYTI